MLGKFVIVTETNYGYRNFSYFSTLIIITK